jgi:hypothetical protein
MLHHRFAVFALPLLTPLLAACSTAAPSPPPGHEVCTEGPGPSLEAVVALGPNVPPLDGATIRICRNGGACAEGTFALPADPIAPETGWGATIPIHEDYYATATIWNEGSDGYVLDATYLAGLNVATDGDMYSVTVTRADKTTAVSLAGTATYTAIPYCGGDYLYFRMGLACAQPVAPAGCSDWDTIECKCRGGLPM